MSWFHVHEFELIDEVVLKENWSSFSYGTKIPHSDHIRYRQIFIEQCKCGAKRAGKRYLQGNPQLCVLSIEFAKKMIESEIAFQVAEKTPEKKECETTCNCCEKKTQKDEKNMHNQMKTDDQLLSEYRAMQKWIEDYVYEHGMQGVVIGLSGGFDSSFLAYLCSDEACLGKDRVFGVMMPCQSSPDSLTDAVDLANRLKIKSVVDDIKESVDCRVCSINKLADINNSLTPTQIGNIKARMRMLTLYAYASPLGYLVINTSNLSEATTGNGTKYGDIAGDLAPFLKYTKTSLYHMAKVAGFADLFPTIMEKTPTADLEPNQTDEDTMGISYKRLDAYIDGAPVPISSKQIQEIERKKKMSAHKGEFMPIFDPEGKNEI